MYVLHVYRVSNKSFLPHLGHFHLHWCFSRHRSSISDRVDERIHIKTGTHSQIERQQHVCSRVHLRQRLDLDRHSNCVLWRDGHCGQRDVHHDASRAHEDSMARSKVNTITSTDTHMRGTCHTALMHANTSACMRMHANCVLWRDAKNGLHQVKYDASLAHEDSVA